MRHLLFLALLSTLLVGFVPERGDASPAPGPGAVAGVVLDLAGNPVPRARVVLRNSSGVVDRAVTDARGRFGFRTVRPGRYAVAARKRGVGRDRERILVQADQVTRVRLVLQ